MVHADKKRETGRYIFELVTAGPRRIATGEVAARILAIRLVSSGIADFGAAYNYCTIHRHRPSELCHSHSGLVSTHFRAWVGAVGFTRFIKSVQAVYLRVLGILLNLGQAGQAAISQHRRLDVSVRGICMARFSRPKLPLSLYTGSTVGSVQRQGEARRGRGGERTSTEGDVRKENKSALVLYEHLVPASRAT